MSVGRTVVIALALCAPSPCQSSAFGVLGDDAPLAYQMELYPNVRLQRFVLPDADQAVDVGPLADAFFAFAHEPATGQLLAVDQQQRLGTLSPVDATFTPTFAIQGAQGSVQGLATLGAPEPLYLSTYDVPNSRLYRIDRATGLATLIGEMSGRAIIDIAIDGSGELYGHDIVTDSIYRIHATTAATQLVGPTGIPANYAQGMDFDRRSGQLYAWIYDELQGNTAFSRIDLDTGQAQVLVRVDGEFEGVITASPPRIFRDGFEPLPATH